MTTTAERSLTCPSGKRRYDERWRAVLALVSCRMAAAAGNAARQEVRTYACEACKGWHLASWAETA